SLPIFIMVFFPSMKGLLKIINNKFFRAFLFAFLAFLIWITIYSTRIVLPQSGIIGSDTADYAQIAQNLFEGKGFTSNVAFAVPLDFYRNINHLNSPWPDVWRDPFLTTAIAISYKVFGVNDFAIIIVSGLFYSLTAFFIFLAVKNLDSTPTAVFATLIWIFLPKVIFSSFIGYKDIPACFLISLFTFLLTLPPKKLTIFLIGISIGLYYLLKSVLAYPFLILISGYLFLKLKNKGGIFFVLLGFLLLTTPWFIRNYQITRDPFFSIVKNCTIPANPITFPDTPQDICGMFPYIDVPHFVKSHPKEIFIKYFLNLKELISLLPFLISSLPIFIMVFFWIGFFNLSKNNNINHLSFVFLVSILTQVFLQPFSGFSLYHFFPNIIIFLIFGSLSLCNFLKKTKHLTFGLIFIFLIIFLQIFSQKNEILNLTKPFSTRISTPNEGIYQNILVNEIVEIKKNTLPDDLIVSSFPFETAFYGQRKAFQVLPENFSFDQYRKLYHEYLPFQAIYINWRHLAGPWPAAWYDQYFIDNFVLARKLASGSILLKKVENPQPNLLKSTTFFNTERQKIIIKPKKNYLISAFIYSAKDFPEEGPLTIIIEFFDKNNRLLLTQEVGNTALRKDRWNYLSEKLFILPETRFAQILLKPLTNESNIIKFKEIALKEINN
ncbi:MAG: glycosyltransferase family 39 protein, partial [Patescibacteria group bacterium]|nr:glycosyltransferase family 39 protein [Patescibacteria group bacterium]